MVKRHLKRHNAPKTWPVPRKLTKFITRPRSGAHSLDYGLAIATVFKLLGYCDTNKEAKQILNSNEVFVNNKLVKDFKKMVGFMDVISVPSKKLFFRVTLNEQGKLNVIEINEKEANLLPCKIKNITKIKGGLFQHNAKNGYNIRAEKKLCKTGDTILWNLNENRVLRILSLKKGATVFLIGGRFAGNLGKFVIKEKQLAMFELDGVTHATSLKYVMVIGENKPEIKVR